MATGSRPEAGAGGAAGGREPGSGGTAGPGPAGVLRVRTPRSALLAVLVLAICVLPLASSAPWLAVLWLLPAAVGAWVLRAGVDVDTGGLTARALLRSRRLPWAEVAGLRVTGRDRIAAVLRTGGELRLPVLRPRHLPLVSAASGGRVPALGGPAAGSVDQ